MTTGIVRFYNVQGHSILARRLPPIEEITETQLEMPDQELLSAFFMCYMDLPPFIFVCLPVYDLLVSEHYGINHGSQAE